jgi:hypothetical protein
MTLAVESGPACRQLSHSGSVERFDRYSLPIRRSAKVAVGKCRRAQESVEPVGHFALSILV